MKILDKVKNIFSRFNDKDQIKNIENSYWDNNSTKEEANQATPDVDPISVEDWNYWPIQYSTDPTTFDEWFWKSLEKKEDDRNVLEKTQDYLKEKVYNPINKWMNKFELENQAQEIKRDKIDPITNEAAYRTYKNNDTLNKINFNKTFFEKIQEKNILDQKFDYQVEDTDYWWRTYQKELDSTPGKNIEVEKIKQMDAQLWDYDNKMTSLRTLWYAGGQEIIKLNNMYKEWKIDLNEAKTNIDKIKNDLWDMFEAQFKKTKILPDDFDYHKNYDTIFDMIEVADDYRSNLTNLQKLTKYDENIKDYQDLQNEVEELSKDDIEDTWPSDIDNIIKDLDSNFSKELVSSVNKRNIDYVEREWNDITKRDLNNLVGISLDQIKKDIIRYDDTLSFMKRNYENYRKDKWLDESDLWYNKVKKLVEDSLEAQKDFYKYMVNNIGTEWNTDLKSLTDNWEKDSDYNIDDMYMADNKTIRDEIKDLSLVDRWAVNIGTDEKNLAQKAFPQVMITLDYLWHNVFWKPIRRATDLISKEWRWEASHRVFRTELKELWEEWLSINKTVWAILDSSEYVVPWIIEFIATRKVFWSASNIKKTTNVSKAAWTTFTNIWKAVTAWGKYKKASSIKNAINIVKNEWSTQSFRLWAAKAFGAKLFEQSFFISSIFEWQSLWEYTEEDFKMDLLFWATLDMMDAYKYVNKYAKFRNAQTLDILLESDKFVEQYAKSLFEDNMWFWKWNEWWDKLSKDKINYLKSQARGYMTLQFSNLNNIKNNVKPKTYEEIKKDLSELSDSNPSLIDAMSKKWENVLDLAQKEKQELEKRLNMLKFKKSLDEIPKDVAEKKWWKKDDKWNLIRHRDKFVVIKENDTYMDYFINNIIDQTNDKKKIDLVKDIKIWDKTYTVVPTGNWERKWDFEFRNIRLVGDEKLDNWAFESIENIAIYITKNKNVNIGFYNIDTIKRVIPWFEDIKAWEKVNVNKNIEAIVPSDTYKRNKELTNKMLWYNKEEHLNDIIVENINKSIWKDLWVPKKQIKNVVDIIRKNQDNPEKILSELKKNKNIDDRLKNYIWDIIKWDKFWEYSKIPTSSNKIKDRWLKKIFNTIKNSTVLGEYKKVFQEFSQKNFNDFVNTYLSSNFKTMDGFKQEFKRVSWIDIKKIPNLELESIADSIINLDIKKWKKLHEAFFEAAINDVKLWKGTYSKKAYEDILWYVENNIEEYLKDKNFSSMLKIFNNASNETKSLMLNKKWNEAFKAKIVNLRRTEYIKEKIIERSYWKVYYSDFIREKKAGKIWLATSVLNQKLDYLINNLFKNENDYLVKEVSSKDKTFDRLYNVIWYINNAPYEKLDKETLDSIDIIIDNIWEFLPSRTRKIASELKKWIPSNKTVDEVVQDKIIKDLKWEALDKEIKSIEDELALNKSRLNSINEWMWDYNWLTKWLNKISHTIFPKAKEYFWDEYFKHRDLFVNAMNKFAFTSKGESIKKILLWKNNIIKDFTRNLKKKKWLIEDLASYISDGTVISEVASKEYIDMLDDIEVALKWILDDIANKMEPIYGKDFYNKIHEFKNNLDPKKINNMADMMEHQDWIEFIRYIDFDLFEKLSLDHNLAESLRGKPIASIWKNIEDWVISDSYNRKRIHVFNTLSHNTVTDKQVKSMWWYMNSMVGKQIRDLASTKLFKYGKIIANTPFYVISQTIIKPIQWLSMLLLNWQAMAVDFITDAWKWFTEDWIYKIRREWNIMVRPWEMTDLRWWPLRRLFNWEYKLAKDFLKDSRDKTSEVISQSLRLWIYNLAELSADSRFINEAIRKSIRDVTWMFSEKQFDNYMSKLSKWEQDEVYASIRKRADEHYTKRTANSFNQSEGRFVYWEPYSIMWNTKKHLWWAYHFLSSWWNQHIKNYLDLVWGNNKWVQKKYYELMAQVWKKEADKLIKNFVNKNADITMFMTKFIAAWSLWQKMGRNLETTQMAWDWDFDLWDALRFWLAFYAPAQWLVSSAAWRQIVNTIQWIFLDQWYEYADVNNLLAWSMAAIETMMSNLWRRMLITNSISAALWERKTKKDVWEDVTILNTLQDALRNADSLTEWYTFFITEDVAKRWYKAEMPTSSISDLDILYPELALFKNEWNSLNTTDRVQVLDKEIEEYWISAIFKWMSYKLPVYKQYKIWQFTAVQTDMDQVLDDFVASGYADYIYNWEIPKDIIDTEMSDYIFYRLTEWNVLSSIDDKELEDWTFASKRAFDMRKKYINKKWETIWASQNREDTFMQYIYEALEEWDIKTFIHEFNRTDENWIKAGVRFLAGIESTFGNEVPWVSYTLVWAVANDLYRDEYNKLRNDAWYWYKEEPDEVADKIGTIARNKVSAVLWDTLYHTNKESRWDLSMYVASKVLPQHKNKFTNTQIKKDSVDEEWNNIYYQRTYFPTQISYDTNDWKDSISTQLWKTDMYFNMDIVSWEFNPIWIQNWFNQLMTIKNSTLMWNKDYRLFKLQMAQEVAKIYDNSNYSSEMKTWAKIWLAKAMAPIYSELKKNENELDWIEKEQIDEAAKFIWWTAVESDLISEDTIKAAWIKESFSKMNSSWYEWPEDKPTWTLLDHFDRYWDWYWSSNSSYYNKYKDTFDSYKNNVYQYVPKYQRPYTKSNSYNSYNNNMSTYLYYRYYYKDAKSRSVWVSPGREKVWRMFKSPRTKLKIPKS